jgi:hypothetical protein
MGPEVLKSGNRVTYHHFVLAEVGVEMMVDAKSSCLRNRSFSTAPSAKMDRHYSFLCILTVMWTTSRRVS